MIRRLLFAVLASGLVLGAAGCRHKCCSDSNPPPRPFLPTPPSGLPPGAGGSNIPPVGVPTTPGGTVVPPVGPSGFPPPDFGPSRPGNGNGRPSPEILLPDPLPGGPSSRSNAPPTGGDIFGPPTAPKR